jgi:outer membrane protein assembly factor BamB
MMLAHKARPTVLSTWLLILIVPLLSLALQPATTGAETGTALEKVGITKGICVVLGLPETGGPELVSNLAGGSDLLVYFQSPDAEEVAPVRRSAEAAGLLGGRVFVDRGDWRSIHLADNLAGAVVVGPAAEGSVAAEELLRVLHPAGKAIVGSTTIVKPTSDGLDDWSYPYHGPDNNPQSADRIARAPYLTQFIAEPKFCPSPAVTVAAGGRLFRACGHLAHQANQNAMLNTLLAVNAHNGTILWKRPLSEGYMILRNTIVATPETLYLADDESCKLLDAATGELQDEIRSPEPEVDGTVWKWMALDRGVLCGLVGGEEIEAPVLRSESFGLGGWPRANWPGFDYPDPDTAWGQGRTLFAIDTRTKKVLWRRREQKPVDGRAVCMRGGRIYFLSPENSLACVDVATGEVVWRTSDADLLEAIGPLFPKQPRWTGLSPFPYVRCNDELLFFSGPRIPRIVAVSTRDGKLAWQKEVPLTDAGSVHLLLRDDALYAVGQGTGETSFSMDYQTREILTHFVGRRACAMATGSADSIFYRAPGGTVRIDLATGRAEHIAPMRPPCYEGVIISGGLLHWGGWKCRCQLSLYGRVCLAPAGGLDRARPDDSRLERGAGDPRTVEALEVNAHDWPCYQGDNHRTSATEVAAAGQVARQWTFEPSSPALPTAPVAAGGLVFVGDHHGLVRALEASSGKLRWKAYTGGAVFFPPAVWEGRLYVGSADGRVYAFEASTGRPLWTFRAAPAERRIPVFGRLVSTWPVAGGVVVEEGGVYAAAGIAHYDGTHVYALDAVTGAVRWHNGTSGRLSPTTHSGISLQGSLYLDGDALCFSGGNAYPLARYDLKTGRCTSPPNERAASPFRTAFYPYYPEHGQYVVLDHTLADGRTLSYASDHSGALHTTLALFGPLPPGAKKLAPNWRILPRRGAPAPKREILWEHAKGAKYNGFVVAPATILAAGQRPSGDSAHPFLAALRIDDGSELWREPLPAAAVKGGVAMDHAGRITVSLEDGRIVCFAAPEG